MTLAFEYEQGAQRIVFGAGAVDAVGDELARLDARGAFLVADPATPGVSRARMALGEAMRGTWTTIEPHVPVEQVLGATRRARTAGADCLVAVGGGSTIGLAKALALSLRIPIVAVPTTYAGSEMTPIYGTTEGTTKTTGRDPAVRPRSVIYDPELTVGLPAPVTAGSGLNALAHCVEGLYPEQPAPMVTAAAAAGIRELVLGLPGAVADGDDLDARCRCLVGAYLAGMAIAAGVALHHKICHVLGGVSRAAHGDLNAIVLPHAVAFNTPAVPDAAALIAETLGAEHAAAGLYDLAGELGAPSSLREVGFSEADLPDCAQAVVQRPFYNPRPVDHDDVVVLLRAAYDGERPPERVA